MKPFSLKNKSGELEIYLSDSKNILCLEIIRDEEYIKINLAQSEVHDLIEFLKKQLEEIN